MKNEKLNKRENSNVAKPVLGEVGSPFTEQEEKIMQLIVEAHNEFVKLEKRALNGNTRMGFKYSSIAVYFVT